MSTPTLEQIWAELKQCALETRLLDEQMDVLLPLDTREKRDALKEWGTQVLRVAGRMSDLAAQVPDWPPRN